MTRIATQDGKTLATFKAEPWPNFAVLTGADYDHALLTELNRRSVALWISFESASTLAAASSGGVGGGTMLLMGGETELEAVDIGATNDGMAVTFAWPASFTNRLDIYSSDSSNYNGLGSWQLADSGYSTAGTNELRWLDQGQLGRGAALDTGLRFYAAGKGAEVDSDGDGYGDSYEHLVLNTDPNDADTDNDGMSDGPFAVGSLVSGPDAFPLDSNEWLDTDEDGIGDNSDTDDDNDGKLDAVETNSVQRIIPITTAPFKAVNVQNVDPAGDDNDTEEFDVSSSGRMLPYAAGGDARGFGQLHGGIFFNHDETNLYIGIAGFEKGGNNAFYLFLDTDGTNGGASSLSGVSGQPNGFGTANNLSFSATIFTPNVGLLLGSRNGDGKNYWSFSIGGVDFGQGVFGFSNNLVYNWPGFSNAVGGFISQWGDRGSDSANAGIEVAISLNSLGLSNGSIFKAAAIVAGGQSGNNRWFSGECYGESASGTLVGNDFQAGAMTLIGAEVYISDMPAPEQSGTPPFTDDDVMLQGYYWNAPRPVRSNTYHTMTVAGSFNGWNAGANNMTLVADYTWEYIRAFTNSTGVEFKFAADGSWTVNWGDNNQTDTNLPIQQEECDVSGANIKIAGTINGPVRFRINTESRRYDVEAVSTNTTTKLRAGYSNKFWYDQLQQRIQSNQLSKLPWSGCRRRRTGTWPNTSNPGSSRS